MSDTIQPSAPAAPASQTPAPATPAPSQAPATPAATPSPSTPAPQGAPVSNPEAGKPTLVGQAPSAPSSNENSNPFEARFGSFLDAEGNFTEGTRDYLQGLGLDAGRIERLQRQGSIDNVFKALDHAQGLIEKRDGNREYIPDPANENEFNQWRDQKGIPRDPSDPQNGYDFKAGLPEGEELLLGKDTLSEVGKMLHAANVPREQANALIGQVNASLAAQAAQQREAFEQEARNREQQSYNDFKQKHGFQFEEKERMLGQSAKAYGFDYEDPIDRAALTNPKVMEMMTDLASLTRGTSPMPADSPATSTVSGMSPQQQIEQIMKDHPRDAWKRDPVLSQRVAVLAKQAAAMKQH